MKFRILKELSYTGLHKNEVYEVFDCYENGNTSLIKCNKKGTRLSILNLNNIKAIRDEDIKKCINLKWIEVI